MHRFAVGERRTPLRVILVRGVEEGAAEAYTHDAEIWNIPEEGIFATVVLVDPMDGV